MAKRVPPLSAAKLAKIKPDPTKVLELVDGAVAGLRVRITPAGTRSWSLNIRANGKMRRFDIGQGFGLSEARERGEELRRRIRAGADPTAEKRAKRKQNQLASQGIGTLNALIDGYFASGAGYRLATKDDQVRRIKSVFKSHLSTPLADLKPTDLQLSIDHYRSKVSAARAAAYLMPILRWAGKRGLVWGEFNLEKPLLDPPKQRVLTEGELCDLLPALIDRHGMCAKFMLLTGMRQRTVISSQWSQIDLEDKTWTVPSANLKDTRALSSRLKSPRNDSTIPLSRQAVLLLHRVKEAEIQRRQLNGISTSIASHDLVFVGSQGGKLGNWDRWLKKISAKTGVHGWSSHALRRTCATLAGDLGAAPHIVSTILGHSNIGGQLVAKYNHSAYRQEHEHILQLLGDKLELLGLV